MSHETHFIEQLSPDDRVLLKKVYREYAGTLMRVVLRRLWRGHVGAKTVVQSVLLDFRANGPSGSGPARYGALWDLLLSIAIRHCHKHNKRKARSREIPFNDVRTGAVEVDSDEPGFDPPLGELDLRLVVESGDWVEHVLVQLDPHEREVLR